jgi:hypothetical protein
MTSRRIDVGTRIGVPGILGADANGNIIVKGNQPMPTNPKGLTVPLIKQELRGLLAKAEARGHFLPAELKRYEELSYEGADKEWIANEAKIVEARKIGQKMRSENNQKRLDAQSPRYRGVISRTNSGSRADRSAAIKERHAKLMSK